MKLYFAYGSNLCLKRFTHPGRVPSASFKAVGILEGYRLVFHKRGADGSGKATIVRDPPARVHGALFTYEDRDHERLKAVEGGYTEQAVHLSTPEGMIEAFTFVRDSAKLVSSLLPFDWYVELICGGGRAVGLTKEYVEQIRAVPVQRDSDLARAARERAFLR